MLDRIAVLSDGLTQSWDHLVLTAGLLMGFTTELKAARTVLIFGTTLFLAGVGLSAAWQIYLGLPARMEIMESAVKQMSQDLCVIRGAIEGIDPIRCLRDLP